MWLINGTFGVGIVQQICQSKPTDGTKWVCGWTCYVNWIKLILIVNYMYDFVELGMEWYNVYGFV